MVRDLGGFSPVRFSDGAFAEALPGLAFSGLSDPQKIRDGLLCFTT